MHNGLEMKDQALTNKIDEELFTIAVFERLNRFCAPELYDKSPWTGALLDQVEENVRDGGCKMTAEVGHSDTNSEVGHSEVTSEVGYYGTATSSGNSWDIGSWVWSYMPGILQADLVHGCDETHS